MALLSSSKTRQKNIEIEKIIFITAWAVLCEGFFLLCLITVFLGATNTYVGKSPITCLMNLIWMAWNNQPAFGLCHGVIFKVPWRWLHPWNWNSKLDILYNTTLWTLNYHSGWRDLMCGSVFRGPIWNPGKASYFYAKPFWRWLVGLSIVLHTRACVLRWLRVTHLTAKCWDSTSSESRMKPQTWEFSTGQY